MVENYRATSGSSCETKNKQSQYPAPNSTRHFRLAKRNKTSQPLRVIIQNINLSKPFICDTDYISEFNLCKCVIIFLMKKIRCSAMTFLFLSNLIICAFIMNVSFSFFCIWFYVSACNSRRQVFLFICTASKAKLSSRQLQIELNSAFID